MSQGWWWGGGECPAMLTQNVSQSVAAIHISLLVINLSGVVALPNSPCTPHLDQFICLCKAHGCHSKQTHRHKDIMLNQHENGTTVGIR